MTEADREAAILRRVERQDFAAMPQLLEKYVRLIEAEKSRASLAEARDLIEWARRAIRAAQAGFAEQRDRLRGVAQYRDPAAPQGNIFRIDVTAGERPRCLWS